MQVMKKDAKVKSFREYLADNDVVLAIVKCKHNFFNSVRHAHYPFRLTVARRPSRAHAGLLRLI